MSCARIVRQQELSWTWSTASAQNTTSARMLSPSQLSQPDMRIAILGPEANQDVLRLALQLDVPCLQAILALATATR